MTLGSGALVVVALVVIALVAWTVTKQTTPAVVSINGAGSGSVGGDIANGNKAI